ncbi:SDR family NAD(P)-dependent oxidoreductase [Sphingobium nicotianae]|uniref:SDR family NAD(P)-dependent oxidoreductase n=1 Tax=Sphingobium nicotianae TaxID=2782607 RepID=A0A9X1IS12_9SPHN|nr:SDR family NAD(P)-dependent oxidoreductase [Sphingobium nicotianae]MBT2188056.1 SDR family NAD(P)-dependent oxidoreductase [Sphingobium nicotianae]
MQDFSGQLAFITGGASGAGFGQAKVFGRAGAEIVIADVRAEAIETALTELRELQIKCHGIVLDIMDRDAYAKAADGVETVFGRAPTILSNTAGVNSFGPIELTTYDDFDWIIGVNLNGVINGCVTFIPRMIKAGVPGHIVTVSSLGGFMGSALAGPYSAAKAASINLMEGYRQGLAKYDIGVSVATPANIKSNIAEASRLRPAKYGTSGYVENEESIASLHSIHQHGLEPEALGQAIYKGIQENALYIIPYPEVREGLEKHFQAIIDSVAPMDSDPEGAKQRVEALVNWGRDRTRVFAEGNKEGA